MSRGDTQDDSWCTIESDPGVFTELLTTIGVKDTMVEELWELSEEQLQRLSPVYGLIFLFKWRKERDARPIATDYGDLFFANQVINNACATQAILSVMLNCPESVDIGPELMQFKEFVKDFPPDSKGLAISNSDMIRAAHNSFTPATPFVSDMKVATKDDDDVFHFISYVPFRGQIYELDGLKPGPIKLADYDASNPDSWFPQVIPQIRERIDRYSKEEIHFNLLAVAKDPITELVARQSTIDATLGSLSLRLDPSADASMSAGGEGAAEDIPADASVDDLQARKTLLEEEKIEVERALDDHRSKAQQRKLENARRRHNYLPALMGILRVLQERQQLHVFVENAQQLKK